MPGKEIRIALVGPYPPPYGGISIHIQRLEAQLKKRGFYVSVFRNASVWDWLIAARGRWRSYDIIHFHDTDWYARVAIGLLSLFGMKIVLTIHGKSLQAHLNRLGPIRLRLYKFGMQHISYIITVSPDIRKLLYAIQIPDKKISIISAYLPPILTETDFDSVPVEIKVFIQAHKPLLTANAFEVVPLGDADVYGIQLSIDLCAHLIKKYPDLGFLFLLAREGDREYLMQFQARITQLNLENHFRFVIGQQFPPILAQADLFIRPTYQDGYAISVAEAIHLGVPAVASDICERASGTILFKTGDLSDLILKVENVLTDYPRAKNQISGLKTYNPLDQILQVYDKLING